MAGDRFTHVYESANDADFDVGTHIARPGVSILVERISGKDADFVDPNESATLVVTGSGLDAIGPDSILANHRQTAET